MGDLTATEDGSAAGARRSTRVGIDLCSVPTVRAAVEDFGDRYLDRIYTPDEIAYCTASAAVRDERLAARFAAKEATVKVLRPAGRRPTWHDIEIRRHPAGWCEVELTGFAAELAEKEGITSLAVSFSHEDHLATAVVVADVDPGLDNGSQELDMTKADQ